jgi:hypothetical protein
MRVLAARFSDRRQASAVRDMLQYRLHLDAPDVDIAPLGVPGQPATTATLLAGRFADELAPKVADLVQAAGGEIVADVDETWTRPREVTREMPREIRREMPGEIPREIPRATGWAPPDRRVRFDA